MSQQYPNNPIAYAPQRWMLSPSATLTSSVPVQFGPISGMIRARRGLEPLDPLRIPENQDHPMMQPVPVFPGAYNQRSLYNGYGYMLQLPGPSQIPSNSSAFAMVRQSSGIQHFATAPQYFVQPPIYHQGVIVQPTPMQRPYPQQPTYVFAQPCLVGIRHQPYYACREGSFVSGVQMPPPPPPYFSNVSANRHYNSSTPDDANNNTSTPPAKGFSEPAPLHYHHYRHY